MFSVTVATSSPGFPTRCIAIPRAFSRSAAASSYIQAKRSIDPDESVYPAFNPALNSMWGDFLGENSAKKRKASEPDSPQGEPSSWPPPIAKRCKIDPETTSTTNDDEAATVNGSLKSIALTPSTPIQIPPSTFEPIQAPPSPSSPIQVPPLEVQPGKQISQRKVDTTPLHTSSAPRLRKELNRNVIDWSSKDVLAYALDDVVHFYNLRNNRRSSLVYTFRSTIDAVSFDPNGHILAVGTNDFDCATNNKVHFFDLNSKKLLKTLKFPAEDGEITALAWHPVCKMISVGTSEGCIYHFSNVFSEKHNVLKVQAHYLAVNSLKWRSDGSLLASGGNDGRVHLWHAKRLARSIYRQQHQFGVKTLAWCPWNPLLLATGGNYVDTKIRIMNLKTGTLAKIIETGAHVTSLHWSKHYRQLVSTHKMPDLHICSWDHTSGGRKVDIPVLKDSNASMETFDALSTDKTMKLRSIYKAHGLKNLSKEKKALKRFIRKAQEQVC